MKNEYSCNCNNNNLNNNFSYWENRGVTEDEQDIINYLDSNYEIINKNILHIGIGNSHFAKKYIYNNTITGITISNKEIQNAKKLGLSRYEILLQDKYTVNFRKALQNKKFDLIVDANLKSYCCCNKSFLYMCETFFNILNKQGSIITSRKGMNWYKKLKPKLTFNFKNFFYYKLKEIDGDKNNLLTLNELKDLSNLYKLKFNFNDKIALITND
tara:strand:+ start:476 stop:1117 length:642 start_codon:yes stop_codon:yes gene_type:complete